MGVLLYFYGVSKPVLQDCENRFTHPPDTFYFDTFFYQPSCPNLSCKLGGVELFNKIRGKNTLKSKPRKKLKIFIDFYFVKLKLVGNIRRTLM